MQQVNGTQFDRTDPTTVSAKTGIRRIVPAFPTALRDSTAPHFADNDNGRVSPPRP